jgi:hypothetical protein
VTSVVEAAETPVAAIKAKGKGQKAKGKNQKARTAML